MALLARLWLALVAALLACAPATAQTFPKFTGLVVDAANVLPQATRDDLTRKLDALQKDTNRQLVVATIPDLQGYPLEDYGNRLIRAWAVGLKDVNNGAILFVAPNEHKVRLEVGYGLEPVLTDAFASQVIQTTMVPRLRAGDTAGAMTAGTDAVIQQLRASPDEAKARTDAAIRDFDRSHRRSGSRSGGGIPIAAIFWLVIILFVVLPMLRGRRRSGPWGDRYDGGGGSAWPIMLWGLGNALGSSHHRDDDGGGWGGGGGGGWSGGGSDGSWGGGGFTGGGGGSGGGGGASGSW